MIFDIKSKEFAEAWRTVSESLLNYLQNGQSIVMSGGQSSSTASSDGRSGDTPLISVPPIPDAVRKESEIRYASGPMGNATNGYIFKGIGLKVEKQPNSMYKIIKYSDGTCEFTMCENLDAESRQLFKDSQSTTMPPAVGHAVGEITDTNKIVNIKPGRGVVDGRSIKIVEPLEVEFK